MPRLSRIAIRTAMLYLLAGLLGWLVYWIAATGDNIGTYTYWRVLSVHLITVGWLTQLIFAVMFWMFPIIHRDNPHGDVRIGWFGYAALNSGLLLRVLFESHLGLIAGGLTVSAVLQWLGATAWLILLWPRVKARGGQ